MIAKNNYKTNKKSNTRNHKSHRREKRKKIDAIAAYANRPNGGCFHSSYWVRKHIHEDQQLQKRFEELSGPCVVICPANTNAKAVDN